MTSAVLDALAQEAAKAFPCECCGILLGEGETITAILPASNVHPAPETHFEIDPLALINAHREARQGALKVLGYYHSHPSGRPEPSRTDSELAAGDGLIWAIIGLERGDADPVIRCWRALTSGFAPLSLRPIER